MFITRAQHSAWALAAIHFLIGISSTCPGKSCRSACVNCETTGRGEKIVDFERDIDCRPPPPGLTRPPFVAQLATILVALIVSRANALGRKPLLLLALAARRAPHVV